MSSQKRKTRRLAPLLQQRAQSAERTRNKLLQALDRFERRKLIKVPNGAKLTVRNLALEAEVSKDTPLSRYPKDHQKAGQHRFPEVVKRFEGLKIKLRKGEPPKNKKDEKIRELRDIIKERDSQFLLQARSINQLDSKLNEATCRVKELEEENERLRQEMAKIASITRKK